MKYKKTGWALASGFSEFIANIFLYPWLEIKRIMQLSKTYPKYSSRFFNAVQIFKSETSQGYVLSRLLHLWITQIPSNMIRFVAFEWIIDVLNRKLHERIKNS